MASHFRPRIICPAIGPVRTSVRQRPRMSTQAVAKAIYNGRRSLHGSAVHHEKAGATRYGSANQPPAHVLAAREAAKEQAKTKTVDPKPAEDIASKSAASISSNVSTTIGESEELTYKDQSNLDHERKRSEAEKTMVPEEKVATDPATPKTFPVEPSSIRAGDTSAQEPSGSTSQQPPQLGIVPARALQAVLDMPPPSTSQNDGNDDHRPPHLQPPPYVHHFNTYALVQDLEKGGFNSPTATTLMKAVRGLLAENMELARNGLVSRSNMENETYLFKAACSELKTEIQSKRRAEGEKLRVERAQLQHEGDILGQRIGQESAAMKDDLKGMFDDRKMALRMEQRNMESRIKEVEYKIQVVLNSDARSEVESIRWVLTRRAAGALGITVSMVLFALNYSRYMTATQEKERKRHEKELEQMVHASAGPSRPVEMTSTGVQTDYVPGEEALMAGAGVTLG